MRIFAISPQALQRSFRFFGNPGGVVSLVGGGGKSTLMYFLATTCARQGKRVLVTTTTNIFEPASYLYAKTAQQARRLWENGKIAVIGTPMPGKGKLQTPDAKLLRQLMTEADVTFVEADGAKHYPCKAPKEGEPVFLPECDRVLAVLGLSAIGRPVKDVCFRLEQVCRLLGVEEDHILDEADAARLLASSLGGRKGVEGREFCVVLNQCDDGKRRRSANLIAQYLQRYDVHQVVMTAFDPEERDYYFSLACGQEEGS